ncbi:MBL fold hydrolase [Thermosporothrix hazakensis]|nr:MBL fold hydrolase [Thermosporothrix hazakensis]
MIDTGMGTPPAREALAEGLKRAGLSLSNLHAIVLTHHHPDHVGLSAELQEASGATVYMHSIDRSALHYFQMEHMAERFAKTSHFLARHGLPRTELWYTKVEPRIMRQLIRVPRVEQITPVEDGQQISLAGTSYRVIWTPGHSDGQICLFRETDGVFLAADHILPRISPNIGLYTEEDRPNPLGDYLNSLQKVATFPIHTVYPGHGEPFAHPEARIADLIRHHEKRCNQILHLLTDGPAQAATITDRIFGDRLKDDETRRMAVAEVVAHLEYLRAQQQVHLQQSSEDFLQYTAI